MSGGGRRSTLCALPASSPTTPPRGPRRLRRALLPSFQPRATSSACIQTLTSVGVGSWQHTRASLSISFG
eukprot:3928070-Alexandrium_andersonii.AAC.1